MVWIRLRLGTVVFTTILESRVFLRAIRNEADLNYFRQGTLGLSENLLITFNVLRFTFKLILQKEINMTNSNNHKLLKEFYLIRIY